jgi:hypothetical protein
MAYNVASSLRKAHENIVVNSADCSETTDHGPRCATSHRNPMSWQLKYWSLHFEVHLGQMRWSQLMRWSFRSWEQQHPPHRCSFWLLIAHFENLWIAHPYPFFYHQTKPRQIVEWQMITFCHSTSKLLANQIAIFVITRPRHLLETRALV